MTPIFGGMSQTGSCIVTVFSRIGLNSVKCIRSPFFNKANQNDKEHIKCDMISARRQLSKKGQQFSPDFDYTDTFI